MPKTDSRVDAYIAKSPDFAKPILTHLRTLVHKGCPDVVETVKWSVPSFEYKGVMCGMAAFKRHCTFGFWKNELVMGGGRTEGAWGTMGRITSVKDLPSDREMVAYIKKAASINEQGLTERRKVGPPKPPVKVPPYFAKAIKQNAAAKKAFDDFSPSHRREYVEWITEAKTDATREKRLATAVEWMAQGKARNWKYMPK